MVHLAFPSVPRSHHWIEEDWATYVEPIARARTGDLTPQKVWAYTLGIAPKFRQPTLELRLARESTELRY